MTGKCVKSQKLFTKYWKSMGKMSCVKNWFKDKAFEQQKSSPTGDQRVFQCTKHFFTKTKWSEKISHQKNENSTSYDHTGKIKYMQSYFFTFTKKMRKLCRKNVQLCVFTIISLHFWFVQCPELQPTLVPNTSLPGDTGEPWNKVK